MTDIRVYADNQDFGNAVALYFTRHKNDGSFEVLGASGFKDYLPTLFDISKCTADSSKSRNFDEQKI